MATLQRRTPSAGLVTLDDQLQQERPMLRTIYIDYSLISGTIDQVTTVWLCFITSSQQPAVSWHC
jgi:hypothetical protein